MSTFSPASLDWVFPFDSPRIHRVLRPVKARITAIRSTAKLSPWSLSTEEMEGFRDDFQQDDNYLEEVGRSEEGGETEQRLSVSENWARETDPGREHAYRSEGRERHKATVTYERRWRGREGRTTDGEETGSDVANAKPTNRRRVRPLPPPSSSSVSNPDLPPHIRLHGLHLRDSFRDAVDKVWSRPLGHDLLAVEVPNTADGPSCSSNKSSSRWKTRAVLRSRREGVLPLAVLASFAYGARIAECIDDSKSPDELDDAYEIVPPHLRRFVLLEHTTQLCLRQVPVYGIIEPLVDVCIALGADDQAFRILRHTLKLRFPVYASDYQQVYEKARLIGKSDQLISLLLPRLTADRCQRAAYAEFVSAIGAYTHSVLLASRGLECALQKAAEIGPLKAKRDIRLREWAIMWLQILLERSSEMVAEECDLKGIDGFGTNEDKDVNQTLQNVTETDLDLRNQILVSLAERALDDEGDPPYPEIAIALGLHCVYLHSIRKSNLSLLASQHGDVPKSNRLSSFVGPTMIRSMSRLSQMYTSPEDARWVTLTDPSPDMPSRLRCISKFLDEHGEYDMACRLLTHAVNHCSGLNGNGRELEGLQQFLREVEKKSVEDEKEKWRYEPVMDAWVLRTVTKSDPHTFSGIPDAAMPEPTPTRASQPSNASLLTILQERRGNTLRLHASSPFLSPLASSKRLRNPISCDLTEKENTHPFATEFASPLDRRKKVEREGPEIAIPQTGIFSPVPCSSNHVTSSLSPSKESEARGIVYRKCSGPNSKLNAMKRQRERTCKNTSLFCEIPSRSSSPPATSPFLDSVSSEVSQPRMKRLRSGTIPLAPISSEPMSAPCSARTTRAQARTEKGRSRRSFPETRVKECNRPTENNSMKAEKERDQRRTTLNRDLHAFAPESDSESDAGSESKTDDQTTEAEPDEEDRDFRVRRSRRSLGSCTGNSREWWKVDHLRNVGETRRKNNLGTRGNREFSHRKDLVHIDGGPPRQSLRSPVSTRHRRCKPAVEKPNEESADEEEEEEEEGEENSDESMDGKNLSPLPFNNVAQMDQADDLASDLEGKSRNTIASEKDDVYGNHGPSRRLSIHVGEALPITEEADDLAFL